MKNLGRNMSIIAGLITVFALTYTGLAPVWNLPLATEIDQTAKVFVVMISGVLSAFTGQKIRSNNAVIEVEQEAKKLEKVNVELRNAGKFKGIVSVDSIDETIPTQLLEEHAEFEKKGGRGAVLFAPVETYNAFRNHVLGKSYDIDGFYGAQCWDGVALLYQQVNQTLSTGGTGAAKGCWTHAMQHNLGKNFMGFNDKNKLQRGDVVVFDGATYGHIAFVDSINGDGTINVLGQNQTGNGNGAPFNVITMSLGRFLGAFRYKGWIVKATKITPPIQKHAVKKIPVTERVVIDVIDGKHGNGAARIDKLKRLGYNPTEVQNEVNARLKKTAVKPQAIRVGTRVVTTSIKDQNGAYLNLKVINDGNSYYSGKNSREMAVLETKTGVVRAAVPMNTLRKL